MLIVLFWIFLFIVGYTFVGYGVFLYVLVRLKRLFTRHRQSTSDIGNPAYEPAVTLLIAAYNEQDIIADKIEDSLRLDYLADQLQLIVITDGSSDRTAEIVKNYTGVLLLHHEQRKGKVAAIKRAMPFVSGEIVFFTDANTFLNQQAIHYMVSHYRDLRVGAVAGEKKILVGNTADASSAGEGFYWKYESTLKKWDYELYSNVGAAGELFSIRRELYEPVEDDTILDDHMIAMRIAEKGYRIGYEPEAYAEESASANIREEMKRKVRIAAGGIQSILRLRKAINPFINPVFTFQYISHRVLRWTITPFLLIGVFFLNALIIWKAPEMTFYHILFAGQICFYLLAITGWFLESKYIRIKMLFIPYYFCVMNYAVIIGLIRFLRRKQSTAWEKSARK